MQEKHTATVLLVDDEEMVRQTIRNTIEEFRPSLRVIEAAGGPQALELFKTAGPIQVVVADMKMPEMDGATLLAMVREAHPTTTRILLTAYAEVSLAQAAIHKGRIFQFLTKPCPSETFIAAIDEGLREEARAVAEQTLLQDTLHGSVRALSEVLALSGQGTFERTERVARHVSALLEQLRVRDRWATEVAASLWQIGWIALPPDTAMRLANGEELSEEEREAAIKTPQMASNLLSHIPRLDEVRSIVAAQSLDLDLGIAAPPREEPMSLGARLLTVSRDFESCRAHGLALGETFEKLRDRETIYGKDVLKAFVALGLGREDQRRIIEVPVADLREGMTLEADMFCATGTKIMASGTELTGAMLQRIQMFSETRGVREPLKVRVAR